MFDRNRWPIGLDDRNWDRKVIFPLVVSAIVSVCSAAEPNQWRELTLDISSVAEAQKILGAPAADQTGTPKELMKKKVISYSQFLRSSKRSQSLSVRGLQYDNVDGFKS